LNLFRDSAKNWIGDAFGAFADSAILFPILSLLIFNQGYSSTPLFITAGLVYLISGWLFRIPMSVQPLKSITITAAALHVSQMEIRLSAVLLAIVCLILATTPVHRLLAKTPQFIVHGIQFSLGLLLIQKGMSLHWLIIAPALVFFFISNRFGFPVLGLAATLGFLWTLVHPGSTDFMLASGQTSIRPEIILSLALPQIVLSLGNSVVGTVATAQHYFGEQAKKVTSRNLLLSIGIGNLATSWLCGIPYCHGAGGLTAHVKGGAKTWHSNIIIGGFLISAGAIAALQDDHHLKIALPPLLMVVLLATIGFHHLELAKSTWQKQFGKIQLGLMALPALVTGNLLWTLVMGILIKSAIDIKHAPATTRSPRLRNIPSSKSEPGVSIHR